MPTTLAVAIGGAAGATARYGLDRLIERRTVALFPWSTFTINVTGCFVIGALVAALVDRQHAPPQLGKRTHDVVCAMRDRGDADPHAAACRVLQLLRDIALDRGGDVVKVIEKQRERGMRELFDHLRQPAPVRGG